MRRKIVNHPNVTIVNEEVPPLNIHLSDAARRESKNVARIQKEWAELGEVGVFAKETRRLAATGEDIDHMHSTYFDSGVRRFLFNSDTQSKLFLSSERPGYECLIKLRPDGGHDVAYYEIDEDNKLEPVDHDAVAAEIYAMPWPEPTTPHVDLLDCETSTGGVIHDDYSEDSRP